MCRASSASARPPSCAGRRWRRSRERLRALRDRLNEKLHEGLDEIYINGSMEHRLPHNLNISFAYVEGESLLMGINDVAVSSGSACTSASLEPSYVLKALGAGDDLAHSSIRFGLGPLHDRRGSRLRGRQADQGGDAAARDVAAVRDGEGRHRSARCSGKCTESTTIADLTNSAELVLRHSYRQYRQCQQLAAGP